MKQTARLFALVAAVATLQAKEPPPGDALAGLDAVIDQALQTYQVPGASVAIVVGDEIVHAKGYGFRDVEKRLPVTPETQMPIASITKQFTVGALGTLVRQGKLEWDKPVRESCQLSVSTTNTPRRMSRRAIWSRIAPDCRAMMRLGTARIVRGRSYSSGCNTSPSAGISGRASSTTTSCT